MRRKEKTEEYFEKKEKAVVKMQAAGRGYLSRKEAKQSNKKVVRSSTTK